MDNTTTTGSTYSGSVTVPVQDANPMSKLWKLVPMDFLKGLVVSVLTASLTLLYQELTANQATIGWKEILGAGVIAGIAYLLKNFGSDGNGNLLGIAPKVQ